MIYGNYGEKDVNLIRSQDIAPERTSESIPFAKDILIQQEDLAIAITASNLKERYQDIKKLEGVQKGNFLMELDRAHRECLDDPTPVKLAKLKMYLDLYGEHVESKGFFARISAFIDKMFGTSTAGKAANFFEEKYEKIKPDQNCEDPKKTIEALASVYKRAYFSAGDIGVDNLKNLVYSCYGTPTSVKDLLYAEKKGTYTGDILYGVPQGKGKISYEEGGKYQKGSFYIGFWENNKPSNGSLFFIPKGDEHPHSVNVFYQDGAFHPQGHRTFLRKVQDFQVGAIGKYNGYVSKRDNKPHGEGEFQGYYFGLVQKGVFKNGVLIMGEESDNAGKKIINFHQNVEEPNKKSQLPSRPKIEAVMSSELPADGDFFSDSEDVLFHFDNGKKTSFFYDSSEGQSEDLDSLSLQTNEKYTTDRGQFNCTLVEGKKLCGNLRTDSGEEKGIFNLELQLIEGFRINQNGIIAVNITTHSNDTRMSGTYSGGWDNGSGRRKGPHGEGRLQIGNQIMEGKFNHGKFIKGRVENKVFESISGTFTGELDYTDAKSVKSKGIYIVDNITYDGVFNNFNLISGKTTQLINDVSVIMGVNYIIGFEGSRGIYNGQLDEQGLPHGEGTMELHDGTIKKGRFEHGVFAD